MVNNKINIIKTLGQEHMMLTMIKLRTQQELMLLVQIREILNLATVITTKICQALECMKKLILTLAKLSQLEENNKRNIIKIQDLELMMPVIKL